MQPIIFPLQRLRLNLGGGPQARRKGAPPNLCGKRLLPTVSKTLSGVSRDATGTPLAGCTCTLFRVQTSNGLPTFVQMATMISDGSGNYSFSVGTDGPYRVMFDLDGAPVRAGLTVKTLGGV